MKKCLLVLIFVFNSVFSQSELINTNQSVYKYLKYLQVAGEMTRYDDVILPLTNNDIIANLNSLSSSTEISRYFLSKFSLQKDTSGYIWENYELLKKNLFSDYETTPIVYKDSLFTFKINPILNFSNLSIFDKNQKSNGGFILYGGNIKLNYNNFTAFLEAYNGYIYGDNSAVLLDKRVKQSFTYNHTKIRYFDGTNGYLNYQNKYLNLFSGRNELKWGVSDLNPMIVGNGAQNFDFFKFELNYKNFKYSFLHGWLVQPKNTINIDSLIGAVYRKESKYIAINRIGYSPTDRIKLGVTQAVIYANRNIELAYLNPFLLWESAQRSLNDLDNSFLNFDVRCLVSNGLELYGSCTFDDLNFNLWGDGKWNTQNNRIAFQAGFNLTEPYIWENILLSFEYVQIRPFTFSHLEVGESLSYTNNGFPIGLKMDPNSISFSIQADYFIKKDIFFSLRYDNIRHGDNLYDNFGNLLFNHGGSYYLGTTSILASKNPHVLDGIRTTTNRLTIKTNIAISYNLALNLGIEYYNRNSDSFNERLINTILSFSYNNF